MRAGVDGFGHLDARAVCLGVRQWGCRDFGARRREVKATDPPPVPSRLPADSQQPKPAPLPSPVMQCPQEPHVAKLRKSRPLSPRRFLGFDTAIRAFWMSSQVFFEIIGTWLPW